MLLQARITFVKKIQNHERHKYRGVYIRQRNCGPQVAAVSRTVRFWDKTIMRRQKKCFLHLGKYFPGMTQPGRCFLSPKSRSLFITPLLALEHKHKIVPLRSKAVVTGTVLSRLKKIFPLKFPGETYEIDMRLYSR